jgi:hypothetical protein
VGKCGKVKMENLGTRFGEVVASVGHAVVGASSASTEQLSGVSGNFQWGGTFSAL